MRSNRVLFADPTAHKSYYYLTSLESEELQNSMVEVPISSAKPESGVDFSSLPWNLNLPEKSNYIIIKTNDTWTDDHCHQLEVVNYQDTTLHLFPAMTSLNYGTTVWEGLKCYRQPDGTPVVFRADQNYERMKKGAKELCLPMPSREIFFRAIQMAVQSNGHLIPPVGDGMKLYIRPMLCGSGQQLGLYPSPEMTFLCYTSPTGDYFKFAKAGLNLHLELKRSRAARGGMGATKCSGNYAAAIKPMMDSKKLGFDDNVFLELDTYQEGKIGDALLQEMSAANVFLVLKTGEIVTPSIERGTILPGVTRDSVLKLIEAYSEELKPAMKRSTGQETVTVKACSRDIQVKEILNATEGFCTGTAVEMCPFAKISTAAGEESFEYTFPFGEQLPGGPVAIKIRSMLREAMAGVRVIDPENPWIRDPYTAPNEFAK